MGQRMWSVKWAAVVMLAACVLILMAVWGPESSSEAHLKFEPAAKYNKAANQPGEGTGSRQQGGKNASRPAKCLMPSDTGMCRGYFPKFFYNHTAGKCQQFIYGGCQGNENRFDTMDECTEVCDRATFG